VLSSVSVNVDAVTVSADAVTITARGSINAVAVCTGGLVAVSRLLAAMAAGRLWAAMTAGRLWAAMTAGRLWAAMTAGRLWAAMAAAKTAEAARDPIDHVIAPCHSHHRSERRSACRV
jgi:hypothetical protein